MSDQRTCPGCNRVVSAAFWRARHWGRVCNPCYKRATRAAGASWAEGDREASRRWKRENLGQLGQKRAAG
jgi:hypothetical protein